MFKVSEDKAKELASNYVKFGDIWPLVPDEPERLTVSESEPQTYQIPEPSPSRLEPVVEVAETSALVLGDLHCPYHNAVMLRRAIQICTEFFPLVKAIIFGGDTFDFPSISAHPQTGEAADPDAVIDTAGAVLRAMLAHFDFAYFVNGNHDERVAKKLNRPLHLRHLISAALGSQRPPCEVVISNLDYLHLGEKWLIGHPSQYRAQGGRTPAELADKYGRNVITFHNHQIGLTQSKSGKWIAIDAGHMTDPNRHSYVARRLTTFPAWAAGFVIIDRGYPYVFPEISTDWAAWGCK